MQISTKGIILGQVNFGDNDRYVTILTEQLGVIEAFAKNAQRMICAVILPKSASRAILQNSPAALSGKGTGLRAFCGCF